MSEYMVVIVIAILEFSFTLVKKIEKLKFMAFFGVGGIIVFMVAFVIHYVIVSLDNDTANNPVGNM